MPNFLSTVLFPAAAASAALTVTSLLAHGPLLFHNAYTTALRADKNDAKLENPRCIPPRAASAAVKRATNRRICTTFATNLVKSSLQILVLRATLRSDAWEWCWMMTGCSTATALPVPVRRVGAVVAASVALWFGYAAPTIVENTVVESRPVAWGYLSAGRALVDVVLAGVIVYGLGALSP
ncbi:hypothetical protein HDU87_001112 [Geranomyces variabilis]|uniref:Uncharacterized protein n=1 Tax=Geranomyces variabilis TaxID=109894 RepID=A0AAD5XS59_9FUNG|nr:hypothetical protein HDU87_001112 [Geranomyces variabilis]